MFLYGKHFSRMYQGSMVGAGFGPYAVMGYVVSNQQPNSDGRFTVDLNPVLLAATFGESADKIEKAIQYLCSPDPKTTTPGQEGRRLVKEGSFTYWVVNGAMYAKIRNEEERREQNRIAQQNHRAKKKQVKKGLPLKGESASMKAERNGDEKGAERIAEASLPQPPLKGASPGIPGRGGEPSGTLHGPAVPGPETVFEPGEQIGLPPGPEFQE